MPRTHATTTTDFSALLGQVKAAGLLRRRTGFYLWLTGALLAGLALALVGTIAVGDSWLQLVLAAVTGILLAQVAFIAHEAAHREVFVTGSANDVFGRVIADLVVGISYSSWQGGHARHHANPNRLGKDPSVDPAVFAFTPEQSAAARGARAWYLRRQAWFYFPILLLAGVNLYLQSYATLLGRAPVAHRHGEIAMVVARSAALAALLVSTMSWGKALAYLGVHLGTFGAVTASSFIVNHVGMPVLSAADELDYLRRQVITSRNIRGGWAATGWMGGLNFQIEHHLFPSMPRPHLREASVIVREFCEERDIPYTEVGLAAAFISVSAYMKEMGSYAGRPASGCPTAGIFGR